MASLSDLLLKKQKKAKVIDTELDALFKLTPAPPKRKLEAVEEPERKKRSRPDTPVESELIPSPKKHKKKDKGKAKAVAESEDEQDNNAELEDAYIGAKLAEKADSDSEHSAGDSDSNTIVHESLLKRKREKSAPKPKFVPKDETSEQRDARTIFVGNLAVNVAQQRPLLKQLQRFILAQISTAKIESTRFRSIPFQNPTSKLPTSDDEGTSKSKSGKQPEKPVRQHDKERTSVWRERAPHLPSAKAGEEEVIDAQKDEKQYLNDKQKKKIAFINHDFHSEGASVNAYIVFAHPIPVDANRPTNLPPPTPAMDPYEAARLAKEKCDGTVFMDRMIRVDIVSKTVGVETKTGLKSTLDGDPKLTIFVGNLDFATKEEDLRVFFEGIVSAERGPPKEAESDSDDPEDESVPKTKKPHTWVTRIRIVRDKETQLGKGFAYIQFCDRECVDEMLALEASKLKFAKRTLRVQRCKTLPGAAALKAAAASKIKLHPSARPGFRPPTEIHVPKGDPSLGSKISHLSKDGRKQVKSSDIDRVARRLAKKKARNALSLAGVKASGKDRSRERKSDKGPPIKKKDNGKPRVRSDKSVSKLNGKK